MWRHNHHAQDDQQTHQEQQQRRPNAATQPAQYTRHGGGGGGGGGEGMATTHLHTTLVRTIGGQIIQPKSGQQRRFAPLVLLRVAVVVVEPLRLPVEALLDGMSKPLPPALDSPLPTAPHRLQHGGVLVELMLDATSTPNQHSK